MITAFDIYLIGMSSDIAELFKQIGIGTLIISAIVCIGLCITETLKKYCCKLMFFPIISIICLIIGTLIPSPKVISSMIIIPSIVNNEQVQTISKNGLTVLEELSKQWVKEIIIEKTKEKDNV